MGSRLAGKVVVVTGATQGIGQGIAEMCASEGATVVVCGISAEDGERVVRSIQEQHGLDALFIKADISKEDACRQLIEQTVIRLGRIDGLVNNAGIYPRSSLVDTTEELYDTIFDVNMKGAFFCSKYAIQSMLQTGGGSIVHMGSTNGYKGSKDLAAYSCSKGALLTLSRHIAYNYGKQHIRSNWVTVGWVASQGEIKVQQSLGRSYEELTELAENTIPSGRMQTGEDLAYGVVYLLSDEATQVTGTELTITGGLGL